MGDVVHFTGVTRLPIPVDRVLEMAQEAKLDVVVIQGYDADGNEWFASSAADGAEVLWLMERCKKALLETADGEDDG